MQMLTAKEVARLFKLPLARVYELTRQKVIPVVRLGPRQLRFDSDALTEWARCGGLVENDRDSGLNGSEASPPAR
jgi:excisionase family DNA binding protein